MCACYIITCVFEKMLIVTASVCTSNILTGF